jgi:hypothetical protein
MDWIIANYKNILEIVAAVIACASVIVRITPTLKDDNILLPIVKFLSKFIALNTPTPTTRPN